MLVENGFNNIFQIFKLWKTDNRDHKIKEKRERKLKNYYIYANHIYLIGTSFKKHRMISKWRFSRNCPFKSR